MPSRPRSPWPAQRACSDPIAPTGAQSQGELESRADRARSREQSLAGDVARLGRIVAQLDRELAVVGRRKAEVEAELAADQARLDAVRARLREQRRRVARLRARLREAQTVSRRAWSSSTRRRSPTSSPWS